MTVRRSISKLSHHEKIGDCEQSKRKMDCHFDRKQIIMRTRLSDSIDISQIAVKSTATHLQLIIIIKNKRNFTHFWHTAKLYKQWSSWHSGDGSKNIQNKVINAGQFFCLSPRQSRCQHCCLETSGCTHILEKYTAYRKAKNLSIYLSQSWETAKYYAEQTIINISTSISYHDHQVFILYICTLFS